VQHRGVRDSPGKKGVPAQWRKMGIRLKGHTRKKEISMRIEKEEIWRNTKMNKEKKWLHSVCKEKSPSSTAYVGIKGGRK